MLTIFTFGPVFFYLPIFPFPLVKKFHNFLGCKKSFKNLDPSKSEHELTGILEDFFEDLVRFILLYLISQDLTSVDPATNMRLSQDNFHYHCST